MALVHWLLWLPPTPPVCSVPVSTTASTKFRWARDQTRLRALGQVQVALVAWTLKLWRASDSPDEPGVSWPDLWTSTSTVSSMTGCGRFFVYLFFYKFTYFCFTRLPYNKERQKWLVRIKWWDNNDVHFTKYAPLCSRATWMCIISLSLGGWSVEQITH